MWFTSDNASGAPDAVMAALAAANTGWRRAYGADDETAAAKALIRAAFEAPDAVIEFVSVGTASNSLALACLCPQWGTVFCHRAAHIEMDECGAPEFFIGGGKLALIDGAHGKVVPDALRAAIAAAPAGDVHGMQPGAVSLTQVTEAGTVYSAAELRALTKAAHDAGLAVHMDGTRFANALARTGESPAALSWQAGVDVLSLGFTKNGALAAEAVILFDPAKAWELQLRRKRGGHLFSKMRFMSTQIAAMMSDGLWLDLAGHANVMAARLSAGLRDVQGVEFLHPVEANLMFVDLPRVLHDALRGAGAAYYDMPSARGEGYVIARLVCSFQTTEAEVDAFIAAARNAVG